MIIALPSNFCLGIVCLGCCDCISCLRYFGHRSQVALALGSVPLQVLARYRTHGFVNHSYTIYTRCLESCPSIGGGTSFFIFFSLKRGRFPLLPMSSLALRFSSWLCLLASGVPTSAQRSFLAGSSPERGPAPYTLFSHQRSSVSIDIRMRL